MTLNRIEGFTATTEAAAYAEAISFRVEGAPLFQQHSPAAPAAFKRGQ